MGRSLPRTATYRCLAKPRPSIFERIFSPQAQFAVAACILGLSFLLGGGARADIVSLAILRPLAVLAIAYAFYRGNRGMRANLGPPFWMLIALIALATLSIIPLPNAIWSQLPGRAIIAANDAALGFGEIARALSLAPGRTLNTIFALLVPVAVMVTAANLDRERFERLLWVVFGAVVLNALAASAQMLGPPGGPFHFFRITNVDSPVGLFSNRNHLAIFFASVVPLLTHSAIVASGRAKHQPLIVAACGAGILTALMIVLVTGSRAGAILFGVSLAASVLLWLVSQPRSTIPLGMRRWAPLAGAGALLAAASLAILSSSRALTIHRFFEESMGEDLRIAVLPQLWHMLQTYFPVGTGFGAFEFVYPIFEPTSILRPTYLNHAHNDLFEFLIEGGVPAAILLAAFAFWIVRTGRAAARALASSRTRSASPAILPFVWASFAILLAGSLGDYPLRTPALMAFAALLCAVLHRWSAKDAPA